MLNRTVVVTTRIEVDGEVKSASSVYEYRFTPRIEATNYGFDSFGTSAAIELGATRGKLFVISGPVSSTSAERQRATYEGLRFGQLFYDAYVPDGHRQKWREVKRYLYHASKVILPQNIRPSFAWVPTNASNYKEITTVHAHELSEKFGASVRYVDTSVEPTKLPFATRLAIDEPWLESMRAGGYPITKENKLVYIRALESGDKFK